MISYPEPFNDLALVASYLAETPCRVPGMADMHRMAEILLAERAPDDGHFLIVGAGGGLELRAFAGSRANWRFTGVDPSSAMLDLARQVTAPYSERIQLLEGTVDAAPSGPFDGVACLLTLHFLDRDERLYTLAEIRRRMRTGAALVVAHHIAASPDPEKWLARSVIFAGKSGQHPDNALPAARAMAERLSLMSPDEEESLLLEAGFSDPAIFYAGLSFRGWVATAC